MTLIAGMICDDGSVLLGADSQLSEDRFRSAGHVKIGRLDDAPLAWGCSGDESIGRDWGSWFRNQPRTWPSWEALRDAATEELSRLNGRRRSLNRLSGVDTKDNDVATVLIAGFVGGRSDLIELSDRGGAMPSGHHDFCAIGSANPNAKIVRATLLTNPSLTKTEDVFITIMFVAINTSLSDCSFPVSIVRITPDRADEMRTVRPSFK
jgi:hypothetical protein